jgi:predicted PurR-regulated permease PerM
MAGLRSFQEPFRPTIGCFGEHLADPERGQTESMTTGTISEATFVRRTLIVALIGVLAVALWTMSPLILLFFGAILIAVTLRTLARPLLLLGLGDRLSVTIVAVLFTALVVAVSVLFGAELAKQINTLNARFGAGLRQWADTLQFSDLAQRLDGSEIAAAIPQFVSWGMTLGQAVLGFVLVVVGGLYLAVNPAPYRDGALKLVPRDYQANAIATLDDVSEAIHHWLGGVLASMALVGLLTSAGLWIAGVQSPIVLGLLAGLANFVPYIGSIAAAILTLIVAAAQGWEVLLWASAVMFVVQQIESNVISPVVVGRAVHILPATGLFALVAMALLFGPLGVLFGFPLAIVADIVIRRLYVRDLLGKPVEILGEPAERSEVAV